MAKGSPTIGQLIKRIHSNEIAPAYSLFGNESFLQDFFIQELATYFLGDSGIKFVTKVMGIILNKTKFHIFIYSF